MKIQLSDVYSSHRNKEAFHPAPFLDGSRVGDLDDPLDLARRATKTLNSLHDFVTRHDLAEHNVLVIEPRGDNGCDEELRAIGIGSSIGHREQVRPVVFFGEVLI